jgi:ribosome biogenesis protein Nip4
MNSIPWFNMLVIYVFNEIYHYLGMLQKMTADSNIPPNNMTDEGWYM